MDELVAVAAPGAPHRLRKVLTPLSPAEAMELMLSRMSKSKDNAEFLATMGR